MVAVTAQRAIEGAGTPEGVWQHWSGLHALPRCTAEALLPPGHRAVVIAPHPDDEVLACGGLLARWAAAGRTLSLVCVTDGEASRPASLTLGPTALAAQRRRERVAGLQCLGMQHPDEPVCLGLPDGDVQARVDLLTERLAELLRPDDVVFAPWRQDGHPDHEATSHAAVAACKRHGALLYEQPIWMWHWAEPGDARVPWERLRRVEVRRPGEKAAAIAQHRSQLEAFDGELPTLPDWALARWLRPFEYVFEPAA